MEFAGSQIRQIWKQGSEQRARQGWPQGSGLAQGRGQEVTRQIFEQGSLQDLF